MPGIFIAGTGSYQPKQVVKNDDFTFIETSDEWIRTRTGISERRVTDGETTTDLAIKASMAAIADAGLHPEDIDMIIASTVTADTITPSLSCLVSAGIGHTRIPCVDINCACTGFVNALDLAYRYLVTDGAKNVLVVCSELLSKLTDYDDRSTCVLFGDGAGAAVVQKSDKFYASYLSSDGNSAGSLFANAVPLDNRFLKTAAKQDERFAKGREHYLWMDGKEVYKFAVNALPEAVLGALHKLDMTPEDLDIIVPHQANIRIVQTAAHRMGVPMEKMLTNIDRYGNTSSASIPMCLDEFYRAGKIKRGDKIAVVGFGGGLTYGAAVFEW